MPYANSVLMFIIKTNITLTSLSAVLEFTHNHGYFRVYAINFQQLDHVTQLHFTILKGYRVTIHS